MKAIEELLEIMRILRSREGGCPWIRQQTMSSILPFTLEETYELVAAVEEGDSEEIRSELGDLLYHIVYYAEMAEEGGSFDFLSVVEHACNKVKRRHPHVFGEADVPAGDSEQQAGSWEEIKRMERLEQGRGDRGLLSDIALSLPALIGAGKIQKRAAGVGFDWRETADVLDKVEEEVREIRTELDAGSDTERLGDEIGDLLFACVNAARHIGVDPEMALWRANQKFIRRFQYIEAGLRESGRTLEEASFEDMESLWQSAKEEGH